MFESYTYRKYMSDLWDYLPGSKTVFVLMFLLRLLCGFGNLTTVYLMGKSVDFFMQYSSGDSLQPIIWYIVLIVTINVGAIFLRFFSKEYIQVKGLEMSQSMRLLGLKKLLSLDLAWHEDANSGASLKRVTAGANSVEQIMSSVSNEIAQVLIGLIGVIAVFSFVSIKYVAFMLVFAVVFFLFEKYFARIIRETSKLLFKREEIVTGKAQEIVNNLLSVKSLGLHSKLHKNMKSQEVIYKTHWLARKRAGHRKAKFVNTIIAVGYGLFMALIVRDIVVGTLSVGMMVVYLSYYGRFASSVAIYSNIALKIVQYKARFERLLEVLQEKDSALDPVRGKSLSKKWLTLCFENVSFLYKKKKVLKDFSLTVKRNQKIGIVGVSGSGKSTLIKLFLRLYKPAEGKITIGKQDIFGLSRSSLREHVTVVLQDQELFNLSLRENIIIAGKTVNEKLFKQSVIKSGLSSVVSRLPQKEHTLIGEKGYRLSGGERQRLGIARAIYRDSEILILDEATSSLDSETEELIQQSIEELSNKTVLVIAHRLATLRNVDKIVFLKNGRIVEEGSFTQLIANKRFFYSLWKKQELSGK